MYYSQYKQDEYVNDNFFKNKSNGFFIEIGAHDGKLLSNTKFFEDLGWEGICVEPIPNVYNQLISNRTCKCINGAVGVETGEVDFLICSGYTEMLSGIYNKFDESHKQRIDAEIVYYGGNKELMKVKSYRFEDICDRKEIDFLSIDTEGSEYDILSTIDLDKYKIDVICIENNYSTYKIYEYLKSKYKLYTTLVCDSIYKLI